MKTQTVGLIGLGVIGAPIAQKLYQWNKEQFTLIASGAIRQELESERLFINGEPFAPHIVSSADELHSPMGLLMVCVKNYSLPDAVKDIRRVIDDDTILLPLENGISAYRLLRREFPNNKILEGYVQGPNTKRTGASFSYTKPGNMHMGSSKNALCDAAIASYLLLKEAGVPVIYEAEIRRMVWQKWMLNTAGNTVTALLEANYSDFKHSPEMQDICRKIMQEFIVVANAERVSLGEADIDDIIAYFVNYDGEKKTSMLEDVLNHRMTENDYITGELIALADKHHISVPINETMYRLIKAKESLYTRK